MIPTIAYDFNFDFILILIFASYIIYGYFSGGHKQIRLSINLILPFMIIYYLGRYITGYLYVPLTDTFIFELFNSYFGLIKFTLGMIVAYFITYTFIFVSIFIFSIYARKHILNENMRAKLGRKNNYLGAAFAFINGYVLVYFIILPVFSLNFVGTEAVVTNFVLEHPPPFSRIARTAEQAVPMKSLADKADDFQQLMSVDGIENYYNESIYEYQLKYIGDGSLENDFMTDIYVNLSQESQDLLDGEYLGYFGETLSTHSFIGVSRVLLIKENDTFLYQDIYDIESDFDSVLKAHQAIANDYLSSVSTYDKDLEDYLDKLEKYNADLAQFDEDVVTYASLVSEYDVLKDEYDADFIVYSDNFSTFTSSLNLYLDSKLIALLAGNSFDDGFSDVRPVMVTNDPELVTMEDPGALFPDFELTEPVEPIETQVITESVAFTETYENKIDVLSDVKSFGKEFADHLGLIVWYVDELDRVTTPTVDGVGIEDTIVSFKANYDLIIDNIDDSELKGKLYLAMMSITSYDVFNIWLNCTIENIDSFDIEEMENAENRCDNINTNDVESYDFVGNALSVTSLLLKDDNITWIILQYKYDYEAGVFDELFEGFPEIIEILESSKDLVDEYDLYYKDIASSLEGDISMVFKIGISVMKYHLDAYQTLSDTPILAALFNDVSRFCTISGSNPDYPDVRICDGGPLYLTGEIIFKAYLMVDNENQAIIYDSEKMEEFLGTLNESVENHIITKDVITLLGDQLAFHVIDESNNYTLLEQMYDDGQISIEAMRILADDDYNLFSDDFRMKVRSLIR